MRVTGAEDAVEECGQGQYGPRQPEDVLPAAERLILRHGGDDDGIRDPGERAKGHRYGNEHPRVARRQVQVVYLPACGQQRCGFTAGELKTITISL